MTLGLNYTVQGQYYQQPYTQQQQISPLLYQLQQIYGIPISTLQQMQQNFIQAYNIIIRLPFSQQPYAVNSLVQQIKQSAIANLGQNQYSDAIKVLQIVMPHPLAQVVLPILASELSTYANSQQQSMYSPPKSPDQSIAESQRKIQQIGNLKKQWDALYPPDWAKSFGGSTG
jgi:hypothetical protein